MEFRLCFWMWYSILSPPFCLRIPLPLVLEAVLSYTLLQAQSSDSVNFRFSRAPQDSKCRYSVTGFVLSQQWRIAMLTSDEISLLCQRLELSRQPQAVLAHNRSFPPSRR